MFAWFKILLSFPRHFLAVWDMADLTISRNAINMDSSIAMLCMLLQISASPALLFEITIQTKRMQVC